MMCKQPLLLRWEQNCSHICKTFAPVALNGFEGEGPLAFNGEFPFNTDCSASPAMSLERIQGSGGSVVIDPVLDILQVGGRFGPELQLLTNLEV